MKKLGLIIILTLTFACAPKKMETSNSMIEALQTFKSKEKFLAGDNYSGLSHPELKGVITEKLNLAADDFIAVAYAPSTEKDYQDKIRIGLRRFSSEYLDLDTEDREKICTYFEEMMDIVGLESSDGLLNDFMYGANLE